MNTFTPKISCVLFIKFALASFLLLFFFLFNHCAQQPNCSDKCNNTNSDIKHQVNWIRRFGTVWPYEYDIKVKIFHCNAYALIFFYSFKIGVHIHNSVLLHSMYLVSWTLFGSTWIVDYDECNKKKVSIKC